MYDELGLNPETDMAEASHLNYRGTEKLSRYLAGWLASNYDLADHRGDEAYASWDENAADWKQKDLNQALGRGGKLGGSACKSCVKTAKPILM